MSREADAGTIKVWRNAQPAKGNVEMGKLELKGRSVTLFVCLPLHTRVGISFSSRRVAAEQSVTLRREDSSYIAN